MTKLNRKLKYLKKVISSFLILILKIRRFIKEPFYVSEYQKKIVSYVKYIILALYALIIILGSFNVLEFSRFILILMWFSFFAFLSIPVKIQFDFFQANKLFYIDIEPFYLTNLYWELWNINVINKETSEIDFINTLSKGKYSHASCIILDIEVDSLEPIIEGLRKLSHRKFKDIDFFDLKLFYQYKKSKDSLFKHDSYRTTKSQSNKDENSETTKKINKIFEKIYTLVKNNLTND